MSEFKFKVGDRVDVVAGEALYGTVVAIQHESAFPYLVTLDGGFQDYYPLSHARLISRPDQPPAETCERDRLNAENEAYRKEAQEARALQRKFYDEVQELRRLLAQVTAERDAANQQCACAVQKLDDLRACLKALAR